MSAIIQRVDYKIQYKNKILMHGEGGVWKMTEREYSPKFIREMKEIIEGEHIRIPDDMSLLEFIISLPDDEEDE